MGAAYRSSPTNIGLYLASAAALIGRLGMIAVSLPLMRAAGDMVGGLVK